MTVDSTMIHTSMRRMSLTVWLVAATIAVFIFWASVTSIDQIVRGPGEIVSSSKPQIIQNLEGGILAELNVSEGDEVASGAVLGRLYSTAYQSKVDDLRAQIASLEIRQLRLEAEMKGVGSFEATDEQKALVPNFVKSEAELLTARLSDFMARKEGAEANLKQVTAARDLYENMYKKDIAPLIDLTKARRDYADAEAQYEGVVSKVELERASDYSDTLEKLSTLRQQLKLSQDQLNRTVLTSPMHGIVNKLSVTTIGGVVLPGEEIMEIIPRDEQLFVDGHIAPKDIANVKTGQDATIKLSAYDYSIYGTLEGKVHFVSADTFKDDRDPQVQPYYKVTLRVDLSHLTHRQHNLEMRPGMQATIELHTGENTILQYLLKPLYKSREALHEP